MKGTGRAFILAAGLTVVTMSLHCETPQAGTSQVSFQSSSYSDFRQLLAREVAAGTVTVRANLRFPEEAKDRYPAAIIVHTIAGYREHNEGYIAAELRKAGFATLTYGSFAARGTTGFAMSGSPGYLPAGVADAYAAFRLLTGEPGIDADRIAIVGFSFGGEVAHLAAFEALRSALNPGPGQFAAHVAFYPAGNFGAIAERGAYTGSPVLMLLGEKDDNLPVGKDRELSGLCPSRRESGPYRNRDLPKCLPCVDGSQLGWVALLPGIRQHKEMSTNLARAKPASAPRRRSREAVRPKLLR
jgi:dienelactone hydrolase